jgi:hydroxymethylglutaryl-CoA reductase
MLRATIAGMIPTGGDDFASEPVLPRRFRRLDIRARRAAVADAYGSDPLEAEATSAMPELADVMVESAVGVIAVPLGIATGFLIDGREQAIPLATEEPSVIAAASFAARIVSLGGGFTTWAREPLMQAHVYLEGVTDEALERLQSVEPEIQELLHSLLAAMEARGGGYRGMAIVRLPQTRLVRVELSIDVRDAMGANLLNSAAERSRRLLERASGGSALMCILSNAARTRLAGASFRVPVDVLAHACPAGMSPGELARRLALASALAHEDPERAVTHNKGIMNGIAALALATGNDTRAVEAGAHAWASRDGRYRGLGTYAVEAAPQGPLLHGELELPLALGAVGGSVGFHPSTAFALRVLRRPTAESLARTAAALGLAQNLAALTALTGEGIQKGHMRLHASRLAWRAGARGAEIPALADRLADLIASGRPAGPEEARAALEALRASGPSGPEP